MMMIDISTEKINKEEKIIIKIRTTDGAEASETLSLIKAAEIARLIEIKILTVLAEK